MDVIDECTGHIDDAMRCLEMLKWLVSKPKLSSHKRVHNYYSKLVTSVIALQEAILTDDEFTKRTEKVLEQVNKYREYKYNITHNNDGEAFYVLDAILSLKRMKKRVL